MLYFLSRTKEKLKYKLTLSKWNSIESFIFNVLFLLRIPQLFWTPCFVSMWSKLSGPLLELSASRDILVRYEKLDAACTHANRQILYVSDLHLHPLWSTRLVSQIIAKIDKLYPTAVLLGGDLVDSVDSLATLTELVAAIAKKCPVYAVPGNHDLVLGEFLVRAAVIAGNGKWLPDGSQLLPSAGPVVWIHSGIDQTPITGAINILCGHNPALFPLAVKAGFSLMLAGHIHGGQVVLWKYRKRLYPAALVYRWNLLSLRQGQTTLLVSRGLVDFIPIRWRCPREILSFEI